MALFLAGRRAVRGEPAARAPQGSRAGRGAALPSGERRPRRAPGAGPRRDADGDVRHRAGGRGARVPDRPATPGRGDRRWAARRPGCSRSRRSRSAAGRGRPRSSRTSGSGRGSPATWAGSRGTPPWRSRSRAPRGAATPRWMHPLLVAGVATTAYGRMYVGAHLPLDLVGGAGLGLAISSLVRGLGARLTVRSRAARARPRARATDPSVIGSQTKMTSSAPASASARTTSAADRASTGGRSGSAGRSAPPPSSRTSTQALRSSVAGSRPAAPHASSIRVRSAAKPSGVFP